MMTFRSIAVLMLMMVSIVGACNLRWDVIKLMTWRPVDWMAADDRMKHEELYRRLRRAFVVDLIAVVVGVGGSVVVTVETWVS